MYLGINYSGISTFAAGRRAQHFRWNEVHKLNYEGKMFIAHLSYTDASREPVMFWRILIVLTETYSIIYRKKLQLASNAQQVHRVDMCGDAQLSKCCFLRKLNFFLNHHQAPELFLIALIPCCRLPNSQNASVMSGGGLFSWGTKFRYSGRTEREILTESLNALRAQHANSSPSKRKANSVPATPSSPQGDLAEIRKCI